MNFAQYTYKEMRVLKNIPNTWEEPAVSTYTACSVPKAEDYVSSAQPCLQQDWAPR